MLAKGCGTSRGQRAASLRGRICQSEFFTWQRTSQMGIVTNQKVGFSKQWWCLEIYNFFQPLPYQKTGYKSKSVMSHLVGSIMASDSRQQVWTFSFGHTMGHVGSQFPTSRGNPYPLHWKHQVLTTGPAGSSKCVNLVSVCCQYFGHFFNGACTFNSCPSLSSAVVVKSLLNTTSKNTSI